MFAPLREETDRTGLEIRKPFLAKGLRISNAESIVTKRVALGELTSGVYVFTPKVGHAKPDAFASGFFR